MNNPPNDSSLLMLHLRGRNPLEPYGLCGQDLTAPGTRWAENEDDFRASPSHIIKRCPACMTALQAKANVGVEHLQRKPPVLASQSLNEGKVTATWAAQPGDTYCGIVLGAGLGEDRVKAPDSYTTLPSTFLESASPCPTCKTAYAEVMKTRGSMGIGRSVKEAQEGLRFNKDKAYRPELLSPWAIEGLSAVLAFGAKKYASWNWAKGLSWSETLGSLLRHTLALMRGEELDPESGLPHVDHILCNAMFLSHFTKLEQYRKFDDRWRVKGKSLDEAAEFDDPADE